MTRFRLMAVLGLTVLAGARVMPAEAADRQDIWFTASPRADTGLYGPGAAWQHAASHVAVVKIYASHLHEASDGDLTQFLAFLNGAHIKLALEFGPLNATGSCGPTEGFGGARMAAQTAARIARLGGKINYVAMDEPYWFGHVYNGPRACHWTADRIARNMLPTLAAFRTTFPQVIFGDIEPVNAQTAGLIPQYAAWLDTWQKDTGTPAGFFHADVSWSPAGELLLAGMNDMLAGKDIRFGVIYNGDPGDYSDLIWLDHATSRFEQFEDGKNKLPEDVIFQSWNAYPQRLLPDSNPAAFTHLILSYARLRTRVTIAATSAGAISGNLQTEDGHTVPNAAVRIETPFTSGTRDISVAGQTPANTAAALVGWRVNTECACDGVANLRIKTATLQLGNAAVNPIAGSGTMAHVINEIMGMRFDVIATQEMKLNSPTFPAQGHETFRLALHYLVNGPTTDSVLCNVIFLNPSGREISRIGVALAPPWQTLAQTRTNARGAFVAKLPPTLDAATLRVVFDGDTVYRGAQDSASRRN